MSKELRGSLVSEELMNAGQTTPREHLRRSNLILTNIISNNCKKIVFYFFIFHCLQLLLYIVSV